ncbi:MAG: hypothetical protein IKK41_06770 [Oscillospiraceae bacterium]|nr:hypothetical protein [Oscillospiraceae bacterium]
MKKFASIALVLVLSLSLCACGRKDSQTTPTTAPTTATTVPPTTFTTVPSTSPTMDTILPDLPDPTMDSMLPDSGLLDTSESTQGNMGASDGAMG